ncbi:hypothetical protein EMPS_10373 [Entomortierella parvispora]|uniref:Uncharacterized protein n=1 Tax=Entomortierella parvispora TaxID=205924 RepID=A0A9P3HJS9_9FUNG|nr:hypothetical protein EMPS_10373 [Entomortierella parvispora]
MPDYYDSWSANKRKKNPIRQQTRGSSARARRPHHPALDPSTSSFVADSITPLPLTASTVSFAPQSTSPPSPQPHQQNTTDSLSTESHSTVSHPILNPRVAVQGWRFSKNFFESSKKPVSYEADFDDVDEDEDDDDLDYEDDGVNAGQTAIENIASSQPSSIRIVPRFPSVIKNSHSSAGPAAQPTTRRSIFWPDFQSKKSTSVQKEHDVDHIEQLDNKREDESVSVFQGVTSQGLLAQSLPTLSNTDAALLKSDQSLDHPLSASTFSSSLNPPATGFGSSESAKRGTQRPRPWSQVIWESPVLGEPIESFQQTTYSTSKAEHSNPCTVDARSAGAYPALTKDLFTQATPTAKERVASKSVRIQIDPEVDSSRQPQTKPHSATGIRSISGGNSNLRGHLNLNNNHTLFPVSSGKREVSHSKKSNRLSLGSGFYASIEPVFLSNATPSTPKTKRNLVRLPARPQSVLIPAGAATNHLGNSQGGTKLVGPTLQPVPVEFSKRRRHQSQQLEMWREPLSVPIPWRHLSTLSANDNARTFHGLGSVPSAPLPVLKKGGLQSTTLEGSTSCSALTNAVVEKTASTNPLLQQLPSSKQGHQRNLVSHPVSRHISSSPPPASSNNRQSMYTPPRFLPALIESSSSFFFKKPRPAFAISSRSSSRDSTISDMSDSTSSSSSISSPSRAQGRTKMSPSSSSSSPFRHTLHFQTRKPLSGHRPRSHQTLATSPSPSMQLASSATAANTPPTTSNSLPATTTTTTSWKRDSSSILFPYSLVSYEIGGIVGGPPRNITQGSSAALAPGTTLPSGIIVSTEVPPALLAPDSPIRAIPAISFISPESYLGISDRHRSTCIYDSQGESDDGNESINEDETTEVEDDNEEEKKDDEDYEEGEYFVAGEEDEKGSNQFMQKSHVAVYEINARWGSRLMMVLVTIGGLVSVLGGGLCAEYHCQDLQFCEDNYQAHGNWCGPSGVDGAPYMLTVGLSMCIFGLYSLTYLRIPTSRLVGYSEIDQFF